jgi:hypothetical protein
MDDVSSQSGLDSDPSGYSYLTMCNSSCHLVGISDVLSRQGYRLKADEVKKCHGRVTRG